ncbi:MAG: alpha/beta fold hydrolase [Acidimicrobiales bacterium]
MAAVVLLHGQPGGARDWDPVIDALAGRATVLAPDRPGYGTPRRSPVGVAANADAVIELLDDEGIDHAVVVGYSWSGAVALDLAQRHPTRVTALVLVAAIGGAGSVDDLDRALTVPVIGPLMALGGLTMLQVPIVRRMLAPRASDRLPRASLTTWHSFVVEQRAMVSELPAITARLGSTTVPAVVVIGETDRVVRPSTQDALAGALPQCEIVRVPRCGHLVPWEAPGVIADAVVRVTLPKADDPVA